MSAVNKSKAGLFKMLIRSVFWLCNLVQSMHLKSEIIYFCLFLCTLGFVTVVVVVKAVKEALNPHFFYVSRVGGSVMWATSTCLASPANAIKTARKTDCGRWMSIELKCLVSCMWTHNGWHGNEGPAKEPFGVPLRGSLGLITAW